jgi:hypothetical protein
MSRVVTLHYWTPISKWCMARLVIKNAKCIDIFPIAHNIDTIPCSIVTSMARTCLTRSLYKEKDSVLLNL